MRTRLLLGLALSGFSVVTTTASANPVIFDNGPYLTDEAGDYLSDVDSSFQFADDFSLATPQSVTGFNWWGVYYPAGTPGTDDFTIRIYADGGGSPGFALMTVNVGAPSRTDTGIQQTDGDHIYAYTA